MSSARTPVPLGELLGDVFVTPLDPDAIGPPGATLAAFWMSIRALINSEMAASYGFEHFGRRDPRQPVPRASFAADMHCLFFLAGPEGPGEEPVSVLEAHPIPMTVAVPERPFVAPPRRPGRPAGRDPRNPPSRGRGQARG